MKEKFTELVQTRLTIEQNAILEKAAEDEGLTVASYVRRIIIKELNFAIRIDQRLRRIEESLGIKDAD